MFIRKILAWTIGISSTLVLIVTFDHLLKAIGVTTWVEFSESVTIRYGSGAENEIDSAFTSPSQAFHLLSIMMGVRVGMAIFYKSLNGGLTSKQQIEYNVWFLSILTYAIVTTLLALFFGSNSFLSFIIEIISLVVIFFSFRKWRARLLSLAKD